MFYRFEIYYVNLDPAVGREIQKIRPCVIISPDVMNQHIDTVIVAPLTSTLRNYPTRVPCKVNGKQGQIVLDQIRTVDKSRLAGKIDNLSVTSGKKVLRVLTEIFAE